MKFFTVLDEFKQKDSFWSGERIKTRIKLTLVDSLQAICSFEMLTTSETPLNIFGKLNAFSILYLGA